MRGAAATLRHEFIGLGGVVERNWYLVKRYVWWELAFFFWIRRRARGPQVAAYASEHRTGNLPVPRSPSPERGAFAHANTPRSASSSSSSSRFPVAAKNASSSVPAS